MVPFLLATLLTLPAPPAAPPQAQVEVQSRAIRIPYLPAGDLSHAEFKATRAVLEQALADVNRDLQTSLAALRTCAPLPKPLTVPAESADLARELVQIANGQEYQALETSFLQAWDQWQAFLVSANLAEGAPAAGKGVPDSAEDQALKQRLTTMANSRKLQEAADRNMAMNFAFNGKRVDLASARRMEADLHAKREDRIATQQMKAVVTTKAPQLSEAWKPVADRLNADAARLADLETLPELAEAPVLVTLQVQAHTRLLDRVRRALWLCTVILCQQKGEPQPAPLGELAAAPAEPRP